MDKRSFILGFLPLLLMGTYVCFGSLSDVQEGMSTIFDKGGNYTYQDIVGFKKDFAEIKDDPEAVRSVYLDSMERLAALYSSPNISNLSSRLPDSEDLFLDVIEPAFQNLGLKINKTLNDTYREAVGIDIPDRLLGTD